ncbi:unnamed protein product [Rhizoctonia solani]|uniref:Uncharacterized protein n=1 Tax=Rhizoctonia solani TaxID=456999 RepID=A0A8H3CY05_9AGAM|nr:unnamed protein product [Rhizoctonia solani]
MPTYAGYLMTPQDQLAWLRREHPEVKADEHNIPIMGRMHARLRGLGLDGVFTLFPVMVPQKPGTILEHDSLENMGYIFARRIRHTGGAASLPPREIPGSVHDLKAGKVLKKYIRDVSGWVVIHQPRHDPVSSRFIPWDNSSK